MFLIRTGFWLALVILLLPSDPQSQRALVKAVQAGVHRAATFCERNEAACDRGRQAWAYFKLKVASAAAMASQIVEAERGARSAALEGSGPQGWAAPPRLARRTAPRTGTAWPGAAGRYDWR